MSPERARGSHEFIFGTSTRRGRHHSPSVSFPKLSPLLLIAAHSAPPPTPVAPPRRASVPRPVQRPPATPSPPSPHRHQRTSRTLTTGKCTLHQSAQGGRSWPEVLRRVIVFGGDEGVSVITAALERTLGGAGGRQTSLVNVGSGRESLDGERAVRSPRGVRDGEEVVRKPYRPQTRRW